MNYLKILNQKSSWPSAELFTCKWVGLPLGFQCLFIQPALALTLLEAIKNGGEIVKIIVEKRVSITPLFFFFLH